MYFYSVGSASSSLREQGARPTSLQLPIDVAVGSAHRGSQAVSIRVLWMRISGDTASQLPRPLHSCTGLNGKEMSCLQTVHNHCLQG